MKFDLTWPSVAALAVVVGAAVGLVALGQPLGGVATLLAGLAPSVLVLMKETQK